ncbi:FK506-binding protein [compost metagenome]
MHVGEKYKLYIPSDLAYGAQSPSPMIPANSVLVFELELLGIKDQAKPEADAAE